MSGQPYKEFFTSEKEVVVQQVGGKCRVLAKSEHQAVENIMIKLIKLVTCV